MSDGELTCLEVLRDLDQRRWTTAVAAQLGSNNALLPAFMADYNARFAKASANHKGL
jgi:hypothetical protein